jgi:hypothetical protein
MEPGSGGGILKSHNTRCEMSPFVPVLSPLLQTQVFTPVLAGTYRFAFFKMMTFCFGVHGLPPL